MREVCFTWSASCVLTWEGVGAVATALAVAIALAIPLLDVRRRRRDDDARRVALQLELYEAINAWYHRAFGIHGALSARDMQYAFGKSRFGHPEEAGTGALAVPNAVKLRLPHLRDLGSMARPLARAVHASYEANISFSTLDEYFNGSRGRINTATNEELELLIGSALRRVQPLLVHLRETMLRLDGALKADVLRDK